MALLSYSHFKYDFISSLFSSITCWNLLTKQTENRALFITVFSNTVSKRHKHTLKKISVGGEGSIQKSTRHHTWNAYLIIGTVCNSKTLKLKLLVTVNLHLVVKVVCKISYRHYKANYIF